jgi:hypothetical protein
MKGRTTKVRRDGISGPMFSAAALVESERERLGGRGFHFIYFPSVKTLERREEKRDW